MSATVTRETFYCLQIILLRGTLKKTTKLPALSRYRYITLPGSEDQTLSKKEELKINLDEIRRKASISLNKNNFV